MRVALVGEKVDFGGGARGGERTVLCEFGASCYVVRRGGMWWMRGELSERKGFGWRRG